MESEANVISLAEMRMKQMPRPLAQIESYWEGLRNGRLMPARSEVDPRGLSGALEYAFVLERIAPGMARFRVAGRALTDLMGVEARGMPLSTFFEPHFRNDMCDAMEAVFSEPAVVQLHLMSEGGFGRAELPARLMLLPLRSDLGDVTRVLGGLHYEGVVGRQPRRFTIKDQIRRTLTGHAAYVSRPQPAPLREAAEDAGGFTHKPRTSEKPSLRLIKTDT